MMSGLLSQSYNIIDTAIAGKYLGEAGLASISCTSSLTTLISSVLWGFCTGTGIYTAILFGAKDFSHIKNTVYTALTLLWAVGLSICILFAVFKNPVFDYLKIDPFIREDASDYFIVYTLGLIFIISNHFGVSIMNSFGVSSYPFYMSLVSAVLNVAGNVVAITVLRLGAMGVALASVLSAAVVDILYVIKIRSCFKEMGIAQEKVKRDFSIAKKILSFAMPTTAQQLIMYVSGFLIAPSVNSLGASATASYSVSTHVYNVCASLYQNSSKTVSTYASQCIGAKKFTKLKKGVWVGFVQSSLTLLPLIILFSVFARPVCLFFFEKGYDGEALGVSIEFVRFFLPFVFLNVVNNLFHSYWRGTTAMPYLILGTAIGTLSNVGLTLLLAPKFAMTGIHLAWALSWATEAVPNLLLFLSGRWKKYLEKYESSEQKSSLR